MGPEKINDLSGDTLRNLAMVVQMKLTLLKHRICFRKTLGDFRTQIRSENALYFRRQIYLGWGTIFADLKITGSWVIYFFPSEGEERLSLRKSLQQRL